MDFGMHKNEPFRIFGLPKNILLEVCPTEPAASLDIWAVFFLVDGYFQNHVLSFET